MNQLTFSGSDRHRNLFKHPQDQGGKPHRYPLREAQEIVQTMLHEIASSPDFEDIIRTAFGDNADVTLFKKNWQSKAFSDLPPIRLAPSQQLDGAYAAYVAEWNVIYLSREFLRREWNSPSTIARAILEEVGHFLDAQINTTDSPGDEGAIFAALVVGEALTEQELQALRSEDDSRAVRLAGQLVTIEQANITGTEGNDVLNGTTEDDTIDGLAGNDTITGFAGNDSLIGGDGNDYLVSNTNNLSGTGVGVGIETLIGGAGIDSAVVDLGGETTPLIVTYSDPANGTISNGGILRELEIHLSLHRQRQRFRRPLRCQFLRRISWCR